MSSVLSIRYHRSSLLLIYHGVQVCTALTRRVRRPLVALEYPLVAGTDVEDIQEAKSQLLRLLKDSLGLIKKADDAPVSARLPPITRQVHA